MSSLALLATLVGQFAAVGVTSGNGQFAAEIRKAPGQERVDDAAARWRLSVFALPRDAAAQPDWSCFVQHRAGERDYALADDGRAFVAVERAFSGSRPLVRAWRLGESLVELSASQLDVERSRLERSEAPPWLASDAPLAVEWLETPNGPTQYLRLATIYGAERWVSLADGAVSDSRTFGEALVVEPPASRVEKPGLRAANVQRVDPPRPIFWGETLEVGIFGAHATPNWLFVGFEVALAGEDGRELVLSPLSSPPPKNSVQAQVIVNFTATARIRGLAPGTYRLRVEGLVESSDALPTVEVRFAKPLLELRRSGGFAGLDQSTRLYPSGVVVDHWNRPKRDPATRIGVMPRAMQRRVSDLLPSIQHGGARDSSVSDGIEGELLLYDRELPRSVRFQDPGASGALLDLVNLLLHALE